MTKKEKTALLNIAKKYMAEVASRGDLQARGADWEDFVEVPVWGIEKALEEAYNLGKNK